MADPRRWGALEQRHPTRAGALEQGHADRGLAFRCQHRLRLDRKSTRLNSSHDQISYAVFCLKKKKTTELAPLSRRASRKIHHVTWLMQACPTVYILLTKRRATEMAYSRLRVTYRRAAGILH